MVHQPAMFTINPNGDYLHVVCVKCGESCQFEFKGYDPTSPLSEITCPKCGSSGKWKFHNAEMEYEEKS